MRGRSEAELRSKFREDDEPASDVRARQAGRLSLDRETYIVGDHISFRINTVPCFWVHAATPCFFLAEPKSKTALKNAKKREAKKARQQNEKPETAQSQASSSYSGYEQSSAASSVTSAATSANPETEKKIRNLNKVFADVCRGELSHLFYLL